MLVEETQPSRKVVDFLEWKLNKQVERSSSQLEFEVASALLELYLTNQFNVTMNRGEMVFTSKDLFGSDEPVHIPTNPWSWVDEQD